MKGSSLLSAGSSGTVGVGDSVGGGFVAHAWLLGGNGNVSILSEMDSNGLYFHHQSPKIVQSHIIHFPYSNANCLLFRFPL